jgi:cytidylate kinase
MASPRPLQIAIDGPAGAGKSTVARQVADSLGYLYVDTGAMYRAVAWAVRNRGVDPADENAVCRLVGSLTIDLSPSIGGIKVVVDGVEITDSIRTPEISSLTSPLSAIPCVRERLAAAQKAMGATGAVVMEGRDIGTVIMPQADVKIFLTASLEQRARRRQSELAARGLHVDLDSLEKEIAVRDSRDGARSLAPLTIAPDAELLDTDALTADEVVARIIALVEKALRGHADK